MDGLKYARRSGRHTMVERRASGDVNDVSGVSVEIRELNFSAKHQIKIGLSNAATVPPHPVFSPTSIIVSWHHVHYLARDVDRRRLHFLNTSYG